MEDKTTHEGIKGNKDKGATIKQVYLLIKSTQCIKYHL